ncbi:MAG: hypothetical protein EBT15_07290 [Betaproteobacteria bacterium]|nr:hypothetical protein [Betaproteobacteria bacterium]
MAKKKLKIIRLRQITDDDEQWVEYPIDVALKIGVLKKSPRKGDFIYVSGEEVHCILEARLEEIGLTPKYTGYWVPQLRKWLRSDQWPKAKAWAGGEWPKGSAWRDYKGSIDG